MKKLTCSNPVCGKTFNFDELKFPKAKQVQCPHCKTLQPLDGAQAPSPPDDEWDKIIGSPSPPQPQPPAYRVEPPKISVSPPSNPVPFEERAEPGKEDFFARPDTKPRPAPPPATQKGQPGWLVIHDERTDTETFPLREGINRIGRRANDTPRDVNIIIDTRDTYISRQHCEIEVRYISNKNEYEHILSDRTSLNGTFVNAGKRLAKGQIVPLRDGDTIQIGRTKLVLVLPSSASSAKGAQDKVRSTDYFHTIIE